ncbi:MAG: hypothetical protein QNJ90_16030 [Planctomycetota bacterium]|nr:hypothetical protein [Planctomycetota bacterium]
MIRLATALVLVVLTTACSSLQTYEGPERDDSQVALIVPENQRNRQRDAGPFGAPKDGGRVIVRINGESLRPFKDRFSVLPGRTTVSAIYADKRTPYPEKALVTEAVTLTFDAVAGRTYAVRGRATWPSGKAAVTIWVVDGATGRSVASVAIPESKILLKDDYSDFADY